MQLKVPQTFGSNATSDYVKQMPSVDITGASLRTDSGAYLALKLPPGHELAQQCDNSALWVVGQGR
jgi:hypothetical protein